MKDRNLLLKPLVISGSLLLAGCSVVGISSVEEAGHTVLLDENNIQLRNYKGYLVAETLIEADYADSGRTGFRRLFRYISGNNSASAKVAMTGPVIKENKSQKIAMTAPVFQEKMMFTGKTAWKMSFVLPSDLTIKTAPKPLDGAVVLSEVPPKQVAVIRYSGLISERKIQRYTETLRSWIDRKGYEEVSSPRSAGYDPPWTIPMFRRNEVHIDVKEKD
jgi:hypothetical protein